MLNVIQTMSKNQKVAILLALHAILVPLALFLALVVTNTDQTTGKIFLSYLSIMPYVVVVAAGLSYATGLCTVPLQARETSDVGPVTMVSAGLVVSSAALSPLTGVTVPIGAHIVFGLGYFLIVLVSRLALLHVVTLAYLSSSDRCRVLIYGAGTNGTQLALALRGHKKIEPVAFVDDNVTIQGLRIGRLPVYSPLRIAKLVRERQIQRVILAAPAMGQPKQAKLVAQLEAMGLEVQALPSFAQLIDKTPLVDKLTSASAGVYLGRDEVSDTWGAEKNCYAGRVILVTGAGGSIGAELCRQVLDLKPSKVILFELSEVALYTINLELQALAEGKPIEIVSVLGSVTEARQVRKVMLTHAVQVVIHAAAYKHVPIVEQNPLAGLVNNVLGTQTLVQQAVHANVERFILISSDKAVRPANIMGASKRLAEAVVYNAGRRSADAGSPAFSTVRFGNVLGSSGSVVPLFQEQLSRGGPITVTDANVMRYFMTVQEAVKLVLESGAMARGNEVFVLDMGEPVSILHLARQVIENAGFSVKDRTNPRGDIEIAFTGLRPGEKMVEELTLTNQLEWTDHAKIFCSIEENLSEVEVATALRRLREAFIASDEDMAREVAMHFVEAETQRPVRVEEVAPIRA